MANGTDALGFPPAPPAMVMLETQRLTAVAPTIVFNSIPPQYQHLSLLLMMRSNAAQSWDYVKMYLNEDTGANYKYALVWGGTSSGGERADQPYVANVSGGLADAGEYSVVTINLLYASAPFYKGWNSEMLCKRDSTNIYTFGGAGRWGSVEPIRSITFQPVTGTGWAVDTRATLYGIL